jgi:uncharacterized protein involved in outer membrane biogenesis
LRIGLASIAILVIGLVVAAGVFVYTADYNRYKGLIEKAVMDATGRQLAIKGELSIVMSLPPEIAVADVTLANASWGSQPQMAHIGQLRVRLKILPLLKRDVDIQRIKLIDTDLLLETDAAGQANWRFSHTARSHTGVGIWDLAVEHLEVERLAVTLHSGEPGSPAAHYQLDSLKLSRSAAADSLAVELKGRSNGQPVALSGQTGTLRELFAGKRFPIMLSGDVAGATLKLHGGLANALTLEGIKLTVEATGTDLATLGKGLAVTIPQTDKFDVTAQLTGSGDDLTLHEARGSVSYKGIAVTLNGEIGNLKTLDDIQLALKGSGNDIAELSTLVGKTLPQTGPFEVSGKLTGSAKVLSLSEAQGSIKHAGIKLSLAGGIAELIALEGIDFHLKGSGNDLAELSSIAAQTLPKTGPFKISGRLTGTSKALALTEAQGTIGQQSIKIAFAGRIADLMALKGIRLDVKGSGKSLGELRSLVGDKLPDTGPFSATARLTGSARVLAVAKLRATVSQGNAQLAVSGTVADVMKLTGIDLGVKGSGKNMGELGPLFDTQLPDLGPFRLNGQLSGSDNSLALKNFTAAVDQSDFAGWAKLDFGKRPRFTVRLESGLVDFTRIMDQAQGRKKAEESKAEAGKAGGSRQVMFSDEPLPFDLLDAVDADIRFNARNIKARDAALEFGQLALRLDAGDLHVDTLEATYQGAKVSANLNLTAGTPANAAVKFLVQGFDLGRFLKETHVSQDVEGQVDLAADLKSKGNSRHQLMANLDGTTGAVIGKGYVPRFLDLLAQDLTRRVITIWGRHKKSGRLNCGVIQFTNKQGIATSDAFLFNTQLALLKGDGEMNLATEQLDFVLSPKPKDRSLFSLATKLRVDGSILDPRVRPDMTSVATKGVKALSSLVLGPAGLLVPFMSAGARHQHPCDVAELKNRIQSIYR